MQAQDYYNENRPLPHDKIISTLKQLSVVTCLTSLLLILHVRYIQMINYINYEEEVVVGSMSGVMVLSTAILTYLSISKQSNIVMLYYALLLFKFSLIPLVTDLIFTIYSWKVFDEGKYLRLSISLFFILCVFAMVAYAILYIHKNHHLIQEHYMFTMGRKTIKQDLHYQLLPEEFIHKKMKNFLLKPHEVNPPTRKVSLLVNFKETTIYTFLDFIKYMCIFSVLVGGYQLNNFLLYIFCTYINTNWEYNGDFDFQSMNAFIYFFYILKSNVTFLCGAIGLLTLRKKFYDVKWTVKNFLRALSFFNLSLGLKIIVIDIFFITLEHVKCYNKYDQTTTFDNYQCAAFYAKEYQYTYMLFFLYFISSRVWRIVKIKVKCYLKIHQMAVIHQRTEALHQFERENMASYEHLHHVYSHFHRDYSGSGLQGKLNDSIVSQN